MTNKKPGNKEAGETTETPADVAPYLSTSTEAAGTDDSNSMLTPVILTVALAAAIFFIFYGPQYSNLMNGLGIDMDEASVRATSLPEAATADKVTPDAAPLAASDDAETVHDSDKEAGSESVTAQSADSQAETSAAFTDKPDLSKTQAAARAPQSGAAYPEYRQTTRAGTSAPGIASSQSAANRRQAASGVYGAERPRSGQYGRDQSYPSRAYANTPEQKQQQAKIERIQREHDEAYKTYQKHMKVIEQERAEAYKAYRKHMRELAQERAAVRKAYAENMNTLMESYSPSSTTP